VLPHQPLKLIHYLSNYPFCWFLIPLTFHLPTLGLNSAQSESLARVVVGGGNVDMVDQFELKIIVGTRLVEIVPGSSVRVVGKPEFVVIRYFVE